VPATGFSIVLPLRDGGAMLRECAASVLAQGVRDFELLVLENGSTDGGPEWLESLGDPRIRVIRAREPLSMERNWARILDVPRREFMTLIGHDDRLSADFLAEMAGLIENHPRAALYRTHFRVIDARGRAVRPCRPMPPTEDAAGYLAARLAGERDSYSGCVLRSADYDRVGGIPPFPRLLFADDALWMAVMRGSYAATSPAVCFDLRMHAASGSWAPPLADTLAAWEAWRGRLLELAADPAIAATLRERLPDYLERMFAGLWLDELKRTSAAGERVDASLRERLFAMLDRDAPGAGARIAGDARVRAWRAVNDSPLRRAAGVLWGALRAARRRAAAPR
jgi:glycosyltransferase involved in cell wall biosynthesis